MNREPSLPRSRDLKRAFRASLRTRLRDVTSQEARAASLAAAALLEKALSKRPLSECVAYATLPGEFETDALMGWARGRGLPLLLPRMRGESLEFVGIGAGDSWVAGAYGVREPPPTKPARPVAPQALVLVPGLGFDRSGGRLGRGAGYYDRALASIRQSSHDVLFVGLGFSFQILDRIPMSRHDVRMDAVLTESEWIGVAAQDHDGAGEAKEGSVGFDDGS